MRLRRFSFLLVVAAAGACAPAATNGARPAAGAAGVDQAVATITARDVLSRIGFLASDALRGRDTPSPELEVAAAYIASEFYRYGLEPGGDAGSYLQRWPYVIRTVDPAGMRFEFQGGSGRSVLVHGTDYFAVAGTPATASGGLVFVGAEVAATGPLRDRVAVIHAPGLSGTALTARVNGSLAAAREAGALGLVVVLDADADLERFRAMSAAALRSAVRGPARLPVYYVTHAAGQSLFRAAGLDFNSLGARAAGGALPPVPLAGVTAQLGTHYTDVDHMPPNVAGIVRGSDPALRDSYVVISAHFDHVGVGRPDASGDSIYNGADDNASGTAAVLELAQAFAAMPVKPRRSILLLAVSGEEKGLLGSAYYADNPTVPREHIVANINIDMIGRNAPDSIVAIGVDFSSLGPLAQRIARTHPELGLTVSDDLWPEQNFFFRSDHYNFARHEIPAIFFFAGVHADYHRPSDRVELIDGDKTARVTQLVLRLADAIANDAAPPRWTDEGLRRVRELTARGR
jgi:hypothetical protein